MRLVYALAAFTCAAATTVASSDQTRFWLTVVGGACLLAFALTGWRRARRD